MTSIYDFEALQISGKPIALKQFEGKAMLIVNTASACGFTRSLQAWRSYVKTYGDKGLRRSGLSMQSVWLARFRTKVAK